MRCLISLVVCFLCLASRVAADESLPPCKGSPLIVGKCFTVHGRLSEANGAITVRIWPVGTHRLLGVFDGDGKMHSEDGPTLGASIAKLLYSGKPQNVDVFGDYEVCPLTKLQPEHMQFVCIEKASNLMARSPPLKGSSGMDQSKF